MNSALLMLLAGMAVLDLAVPIARIELRAVVQGICLLVAVTYMVRPKAVNADYSRFLPVFFYLIIICLSSVASGRPIFVLTQCASLGAVLIFAVAYAVHRESAGSSSERKFAGAILLVVVPFMIVSTAQYFLGFGNPFEFSTGRMRLEGVYEEPATLAAMSGILIGTAMTFRMNIVLKLLIIGSAVVCLFGTGSRTFMVASGLAATLTIALYYRQYRWKVLTSALILVLLTMLVGRLGIGPGAAIYENYARTDSVKTLTGRTEIWSSALEKIKDAWLLGYGFTLGTQAAHYPGLGLQGGGEGRPSGALHANVGATSQAKLHSGYVQAVLDTGALGGVAYCLLLVLAWYRLLIRDADRRNPLLMYLLCYFTVANGAETIIHSASVLRSVLAWITVVLALSLRAAPRLVVARYVGRFVT